MKNKIGPDSREGLDLSIKGTISRKKDLDIGIKICN